MLLYEDYFSSETSLSSSLLFHNSISNATVYDIILLPPSRSQQNLKQQYASTITWLVSRLERDKRNDRQNKTE